MQLRAADGRVLLGGREPEQSTLPPDLGAALREWAEVAAAVARTGQPGEAELVRQRGRELAALVATQHGVPVEYVDPVSGLEAELVEPVHEPVGSRERAVSADPTGPTAVAPEPTPWATGLAVSAIFTLVVVVAVVALHRGFADSGVVRGSGLGWLPVVANVLVGLGLAPSLWILARKPFWRWMAYGIAAGILLAWLLLLVGALLGSG